MAYKPPTMRHRHDRVRRGRAFRSVCIVAVATALAVAGCAPKGGFSGFLGDYSKLERDAILDNSLAYTNPTNDLKQYTKFTIERTPASVRRWTPSRCSRASSPPSWEASAWDSRSVARSSRSTAGESTRRPPASAA